MTVQHKAMFVNGAWRKPETGKRHEVSNPATGVAMATVPSAKPLEAKLPIAVVHQAFPKWTGLTAQDLVKDLKVGHATSADSMIGLLIDEAAYRKVEDHV